MVQNSDKITEEVVRFWTKQVSNILNHISICLPDMNFDTVGSSTKTETSKFLDAIFTQAFGNTIKHFNLENNWQLAGSNQKGHDSVYFGQPLEHKFSLNNVGFTGNSHSDEKSNLYLLGKVEIKNNEVVKLFLAFADLSDKHHPETGWSHKQMTEEQLAKHSKKCGFSDLKFHHNDAPLYKIIWGGVKQNTKWCKEIPAPI